MLVSHRYRFILIKTRKTAGSSLEGLLEPLCVPEGHVVQHAVDEIVTPAGIVGARASDKGGRSFTAHMSAKRIKKALPRGVFDSYTKILPVRDPFDKVVSWYWHVMPDETKERVANDFADARSLFRDWIKMRPSLNTDEGFYQIRGQRIDCLLVRYEELAEGVAAVSEAIGVPLDLNSLPRWKSGSRLHKEHAAADYYDKRAADIVRARFTFDFENFGYDPNSVCPS